MMLSRDNMKIHNIVFCLFRLYSGDYGMHFPPTKHLPYNVMSKVDKLGNFRFPDL